MPAPLEGRVALVTGASKNIGKGIALEVGAERRDDVPDRAHRSTDVPGQLASLERTAAEIEAAGGRAIPVACDHTDDAQVEAVFDRIADGAGPSRRGRERRLARLLRDGRRAVLGAPARRHDALPRDRAPVQLRDDRARGAPVHDPAGLRCRRSTSRRTAPRRTSCPSRTASARPRSTGSRATPRSSCSRTASPSCRCGPVSCSPRACSRTRRSAKTADACCTGSTSASARARSSTAGGRRPRRRPRHPRPHGRFLPVEPSRTRVRVHRGRRVPPARDAERPRLAHRFVDDIPDYWRGVERYADKQ